MGGMEFNKIFAAILVAGIIAGFGGFAAKFLIHPKTPAEFAYNVEEMEGSAGGGAAKVALAEPVLAMLASADAARGEKVAKACAACHTFTQGGANGVGPNLYNVIGGPKDHVAGFAYSGALLNQGGNTWTYAEMNKFLWKPKVYAPGTKMSFIGLKKPEDRAAVIAYLRSLSASPKALPSDAEIAAEAAELAPPEEEAPVDASAEAPADAKAAEPVAH